MQSPTRKAQPFDTVAEEYDALFTGSLVGKAQRDSVWRITDRVFRPGLRVLDMNCGTGVDALHLAAQGIQVVACDASREMIAVARRRVATSVDRDGVELRVLAIEQIDQLRSEDLYDGVLSNFAGLNCVADLRNVARDLAALVRPGGTLILCLFGRFCLWEMIWYALQGDLKKAFRRLHRRGIVANLAPGQTVLVRYPSVASVRRDFSPHFRLVGWKGAGVAVPPSYLEHLALRYARAFRWAAKLDSLLDRCPGFGSLADHVVLEFERVRL